MSSGKNLLAPRIQRKPAVPALPPCHRPPARPIPRVRRAGSGAGDWNPLIDLLEARDVQTAYNIDTKQRTRGSINK